MIITPDLNESSNSGSLARAASAGTPTPCNRSQNSEFRLLFGVANILPGGHDYNVETIEFGRGEHTLVIFSEESKWWAIFSPTIPVPPIPWLFRALIRRSPAP